MAPLLPIELQYRSIEPAPLPGTMENEADTAEEEKELAGCGESAGEASSIGAEGPSLKTW